MEPNLKPLPCIPASHLPLRAFALLRNPLIAISRMMDRYGDIFCMKLPGNTDIVFLNHPDYVRHVLKDNQPNYSRGRAVKRSSVTGLDEFLGNGIFMSDGDDWEMQHKLLKPLFTSSAIAMALPMIEAETRSMHEKWSREKNNGYINVERDIHLLMLSIMLKTQVSRHLDLGTEEIYDALMGRMEASSVKALFNFQLKSFLLSPFGVRYKYDRHAVFLQRLESIAQKVVDGLIANDYEPVGLFANLHQAFLSGQIGKQEIRDQFMNFVFAAFDTTATAISWTLFNIAHQPGLQRKIWEELAPELSKGLPLPALALPTLQLTISETLRLYPPVWSYAREAANDDRIGGHPIKAGSIVVINSYKLHRDPRNFPSGDGFALENFEKENSKGKTFAYIPFGQGKRMCIGRGMAGYQMQTIIAATMQKFVISTGGRPAPEINANIIIKGKTPIMLKLSERDG